MTQMPLPSITAVEQAGGVVTVAGAGIHNWAGMGQDDPFQVRDIQDDFGNLGARFAELVQRLQPSLAQLSLPPPPVNTSE